PAARRRRQVAAAARLQQAQAGLRDPAGGLVPRAAAHAGRRHLRQPWLPRARADAAGGGGRAAARPRRTRHRPQRSALAGAVPGALGPPLPRRGRRAPGRYAMMMKLLLAVPLLYIPNMLHLSVETGVPGLNLANIVFMVVVAALLLGGPRYRP